jgi:hypothetical protein
VPLGVVMGLVPPRAEFCKKEPRTQTDRISTVADLVARQPGPESWLPHLFS